MLQALAEVEEIQEATSIWLSQYQQIAARNYNKRGKASKVPSRRLRTEKNILKYLRTQYWEAQIELRMAISNQRDNLAQSIQTLRHGRDKHTKKLERRKSKSLSCKYFLLKFPAFIYLFIMSIKRKYSNKVFLFIHSLTNYK